MPTTTTKVKKSSRPRKKTSKTNEQTNNENTENENLKQLTSENLKTIDTEVLITKNITQTNNDNEKIETFTTSIKITKKRQKQKSDSCSTASSVATSTTTNSTHKQIRSVKTLTSVLNTSISNRSCLNMSSNRKITDFFQIRKSSRKCKSDIEKEKRLFIEDAIKNCVEEGLEIKHLENKGRGVFSTKHFSKGDFVCEYAGEMVNYQLAKKREEEYAKDPSIGCYMYFFEYKSKSYCIDATAETNRLGRLLNHSKTEGNCQTKLFEVNTKPHLILVAARDIKPGEELLYDYGDRNKVSIESHPWLAK